VTPVIGGSGASGVPPKNMPAPTPPQNSRAAAAAAPMVPRRLRRRLSARPTAGFRGFGLSDDLRYKAPRTGPNKAVVRTCGQGLPLENRECGLYRAHNFLILIGRLAMIALSRRNHRRGLDTTPMRRPWWGSIGAATVMGSAP
jgi:hypothetical protein